MFLTVLRMGGGPPLLCRYESFKWSAVGMKAEVIFKWSAEVSILVTCHNQMTAVRNSLGGGCPPQPPPFVLPKGGF